VQPRGKCRRRALSQSSRALSLEGAHREEGRRWPEPPPFALPSSRAGSSVPPIECPPRNSEGGVSAGADKGRSEIRRQGPSARAARGPFSLELPALGALG